MTSLRPYKEKLIKTRPVTEERGNLQSKQGSIGWRDPNINRL